MRIIPLVSAIAVAGFLAAGCATQKTYETVLDVCSSGNGTVKSAKVVKSSGDAQIDAEAIKVGQAMVYEPTAQLSCKPLTVEHKSYGETA